MENFVRVASIDAKKLSPVDLMMYRKNREVLSKVIGLQQKWKEAKTTCEKLLVKALMIKFINDNFEGVEKTCAFLGVYSTPYTLCRIRKQLEESLREILDKYNIPAPNKPKEKKQEVDVHEIEYLADELDIWWNLKQK